MTDEFIFSRRPDAWGIEPGAASDGGALLRLGARRMRIADIADVEVEARQERDNAGLILVAVGFGLAAFALLFCVVALEWRTRFLIGSGFLSALALTALADIWSLKPVRYWRMTVATRQGERHVFTSAEKFEIEALLAALSRA